MEFSRQEYWSGLPFLLQGILPNPGIKPASPASPSLAGDFFTTEPPGKPHERDYKVVLCLSVLSKNKKNKSLPWNHGDPGGGVCHWIKEDCDIWYANDTEQQWKVQNEWSIRAAVIHAHLIYLECGCGFGHEMLREWVISTTLFKLADGFTFWGGGEE